MSVIGKLTGRNTPIPPNVIPAIKTGYDRFSCRRCGYGLADGDHKRRLLYTKDHSSLEPHWEYCPNCGQAILHAEYAGLCGWTKESADKKYEEICIRHNEVLKNGTDRKIDCDELITRISDLGFSMAQRQCMIGLIKELAKFDDDVGDED